MDGTPTMTELRPAFRTPSRILLPKLLKSRDGWKAKSHQRKAQLKAAQIKIRDLSASRTRWRDQAAQLETENQQLRARLERAERELQLSQAALADAQKK